MPFDHLPPFPCDSKPRLSIGATSGNVIPFHPERKPEPGRWRRAALIALGIAVLAATALLASGCAPERIVEPVPSRLSRTQAFLVSECRYLGGMPVTRSYEEDGVIGVAAVCVRAPVASLGGRR
jgi:hypothetical protein